MISFNKIHSRCNLHCENEKLESAKGSHVLNTPQLVPLGTEWILFSLHHLLIMIRQLIPRQLGMDWS